jgi:transposase
LRRNLTVVSRPGAERFTAPAEPNQRRYEALRAYFVEQQSAKAVAEHFGYNRSTVETLVRDWRAGRLGLFASSRPGPRRQPKTDRAHTLALALRCEGRSLREIERALRAEGVPLSRTAIWKLAEEAGARPGRQAGDRTGAGRRFRRSPAARHRRRRIAGLGEQLTES